MIASQRSFIGTWSTDWGDLSFQETRGKVYGGYRYKLASGEYAQGTVEGREKEGTLTGKWKESGAGKAAAGEATLKLRDDGKTFSGSWHLTSGTATTTSGTWTGKRKQAVPAVDEASRPELLGPTSNVIPDKIETWSDDGVAELEEFVSAYLYALLDTATEYLDETSPLKAGTGLAEIFNILDRLKEEADKGRLSNEQAQQELIQAFKHLGLDTVRFVGIVAILRAAVQLGTRGLSALRNKLRAIQVATEAGKSFERNTVLKIAKAGGRNLNNWVRDKGLGRGGNKFLVDAWTKSGEFVSVASGTPRVLQGKFRALFGEGEVVSNYRKALNDLSVFTREITNSKKKLTELAFQMKAKLYVPKAQSRGLQNWIRQTVIEWGQPPNPKPWPDSPLYRHLMKHHGNDIEQVANAFADMVVGR